MADEYSGRLTAGLGARLSSLIVVAGIILFASAQAAVTIGSNTTITAGKTTLDGQDVIVTGATLTVEGPHPFNSLTVKSGGTVTNGAGGYQITLAVNSVVEGGGTIKGGTITASGGAQVVAAVGTLDGVTLGADLAVRNSSTLTVKNGLVLNNVKVTFASIGNSNVASRISIL